MPLQAPGQPSDNAQRDFASASVANVIGYRFKDLDPGANIYIQRDDKLVIQAFSFLSNEVLNVNIRLLQPGHPPGRTQPDSNTVDNPQGDSIFGVIVPINVMVPITTSFLSFTRTIDLAEGYLMSVAVSGSAATVRGQTFVRAFIIRGSASLANASYLLASDYITTNTSIGWPYGDVRQPTDGQGLLFTESLGAPAAGTDFTFVMGGLRKGLLLSLEATLTTSAAVANRIVTGRLISSGATEVGTYPPSQVIPASTVAKVTFAPGVNGNAVTPTIVTVGLPQTVFLTENQPLSQRLLTTTINIQAGDQWSGVVGLFQEWLDF